MNKLLEIKKEINTCNQMGSYYPIYRANDDVAWLIAEVERLIFVVVSRNEALLGAFQSLEYATAQGKEGVDWDHVFRAREKLQKELYPNVPIHAGQEE